MFADKMWIGAIFPITADPRKEPFQKRTTLNVYIMRELQDIEDHDFHYGVHYEAKKWSRVEKAWRGEIMLSPFPSDRLGAGAIIFFNWKKSLFGYGTLEAILINDRTTGNFPLNGTWEQKIYPYIVKFVKDSIHACPNGIPSEDWSEEIGWQETPKRSTYVRLDRTQINGLLHLFETTDCIDTEQGSPRNEPH